MINNQPAAPKWLILLCFFNVYVIWGSTYLAVAYGLKGFPPFILLALRYLSAGIILFLYCKFKREATPHKWVLGRNAISGLMMLVGGTGAIAWAEQYISSGQAAILIATCPLWFLLLDRKNWHNYFRSKLTIAGLIIGFTGVYLFVKFDDTQGVHTTMSLIATLVILASCLFWVMGSLLSRQYKSSSSMVMTSSTQLLAAGSFCAITAFGTGEWRHFNSNKIPGQAWLGLVFLIIMGSLVAYLSFIYLINNRPPALVSTHTYVNPVVAVFLGWLLANEQLTKGQYVGLAVILMGILLVNLPEYLKGKQERLTAAK